MALPLAEAMAQDSASIRAILFYPPFCEECPEVIDEFLVPLSAMHAERLELYPVDISESPGDKIFQEVLDYFGIGTESLNRPSVLVGKQLLRGKSEITEGLPSLIEGEVPAKGFAWPDVPGLQMLIDGEETDDTAETTAGNDSIASWLAWSVMVAMLFSLMHGAWRLAYNDSRLSNAPSVSSWGLPLFALLGLGIGIYLTSVSLTHSEAMCGPIGDCMRVHASPHSKLFGIPMAIWGMVFYLGILGLWLLQRLLAGSWRLRSTLGLLVLSIFGLMFSIYLTGLELFVIHAVCIWCLMSAVLATLIMLTVTRKITTAN